MHASLKNFGNQIVRRLVYCMLLAKKLSSEKPTAVENFLHQTLTPGGSPT